MPLKNLFSKKKKTTNKKPQTQSKQKQKQKSPHNEKIAARKGELGEYKIDIQLDQLPKEYKYLSDLLVKNPKSKTGYSQIDHVVITPFGLFVIETKNYQGTIYGGVGRKTWLVNGKFKFMNPFVQNYGHIEALKNIVDQKFHQWFYSMVSFTKRCTFKVDVELRKILSNELIVYDIELSEFIHRKVSIQKVQYKESLIQEGEINAIYQAILKENITDPKIRQEHIDGLKNDRAKATNANSSQAQKAGKYKCSVCQKPVSDKVQAYCLSNKKFKGKIYCYEHQKAL